MRSSNFSLAPEYHLFKTFDMKLKPSGDTSKSSSNLSQKLDRHFLACSALVGVATLAGTENASAVIQYSGLLNLNVPTSNGQGGIYIDLEGFTTFSPNTN